MIPSTVIAGSDDGAQNCAPMMMRGSRMPAEIILRILFETLFGADATEYIWIRRKHGIERALTLHLVCRDWRDILRSSPTFWGHALLLVSGTSSWKAILTLAAQCDIDISSCNQTVAKLQVEILSRCRAIHITPLTRYQPWNRYISDAPPLKRLKYLYIHRNHLYPLDAPQLHVDAPGLLDLEIDCAALVNAPSLQRLWLCDEHGSMSTSALKGMLTSFPALKKLEMNFSSRREYAYEWRDVLEPLSGGPLEYLTLKLPVEASTIQIHGKPIVFPKLVEFRTHAAVALIAPNLHTLETTSISVADLTVMLSSLPKIRELRVLGNRLFWNQHRYNRSASLNHSLTNLTSLRTFSYSQPIDPYLVELLSTLSLPSLEDGITLSLQLPVKAAFGHIDDYANVRSCLRSQRHHLLSLSPALQRLFPEHAIVTVRSTVTAAGYTRVVFEASRDHGGWCPVSISISYQQSQHWLSSNSDFPLSTSHILSAFAWPNVRELRIEGEQHGHNVSRMDWETSLLPDPLNIVDDEDRTHTQENLRNMPHIRELHLVVTEPSQYSGMGLFTAMLSCPKNEVLLPELEFIRLEPDPRGGVISVESGVWLEQICAVTELIRRPHRVRVELDVNIRTDTDDVHLQNLLLHLTRPEYNPNSCKALHSLVSVESICRAHALSDRYGVTRETSSSLSVTQFCTDSALREGRWRKFDWLDISVKLIRHYGDGPVSIKNGHIFTSSIQQGLITTIHAYKIPSYHPEGDKDSQCHVSLRLPYGGVFDYDPLEDRMTAVVLWGVDLLTAKYSLVDVSSTSDGTLSLSYPCIFPNPPPDESAHNISTFIVNKHVYTEVVSDDNITYRSLPVDLDTGAVQDKSEDHLSFRSVICPVRGNVIFAIDNVYNLRVYDASSGPHPGVLLGILCLPKLGSLTHEVTEASFLLEGSSLSGDTGQRPDRGVILIHIDYVLDEDIEPLPTFLAINIERILDRISSRKLSPLSPIPWSCWGPGSSRIVTGDNVAVFGHRVLIHTAIPSCSADPSPHRRDVWQILDFSNPEGRCNMTGARHLHSYDVWSADYGTELTDARAQNALPDWGDRALPCVEYSVHGPQASKFYLTDTRLVLLHHDRTSQLSVIERVLRHLPTSDILVLREVCKGLSEHPIVRWMFAKAIFEVGYLSVIDKRRMDATCPDVKGLAAYVHAREERWFTLSWKAQSAMWPEYFDNVVKVGDGYVVTLSTSFDRPVLHAYRIPWSIDGSRLWGVTWSLPYGLVMLRGSRLSESRFIVQDFSGRYPERTFPCIFGSDVDVQDYSPHLNIHCADGFTFASFFGSSENAKMSYVTDMISRRVISLYLMRLPRAKLSEVHYVALADRRKLLIIHFDHDLRLFSTVCTFNLPSVDDPFARYHLTPRESSTGPTSISDECGLMEVDLYVRQFVGCVVIDIRRLLLRIKSTVKHTVVPWSQWSDCCRFISGTTIAVYAHRVLIYCRDDVTSTTSNPERVNRWRVLHFNALAFRSSRCVPGVGVTNRLISSADILACDYTHFFASFADESSAQTLPCVESVVYGPPCSEGSMLFMDAERFAIFPGDTDDEMYPVYHF
ncbi:hypothetical protein PENSPDRAFT_667358 [Peniophora sp. CONT]|nr:hypothetical protein PENSPDRAFT_667358 [Peniophora sp. CONT]